jgi:hypothetical protein
MTGQLCIYNCEMFLLLTVLAHARREYFEVLADHLTQQALAYRRVQRCACLLKLYAPSPSTHA